MDKLQYEILTSTIFRDWWNVYCKSEQKYQTLTDRGIKIVIIDRMISSVKNDLTFIFMKSLFIEENKQLEIPIEIIIMIKEYLSKNNSQFFNVEEYPNLFWLKDRQYRHLVFTKIEQLYFCLGRITYPPPEEGQVGGRSDYHNFEPLSDNDKNYLHNLYL
jgi:hypothetical protein